VPALGAGANSDEGATRPKNEEAYDLYLRSIAVPHDPAPNKDAIAMLERAVGLDPTYAPAWDALGLRYHFDAAYGTGGEVMAEREKSALERALALDPNFINPAAQLTGREVERGNLVKGYQDAKALVVRHPENAMAHFALSYVLRYGGAVEESAHECDTALALLDGFGALLERGVFFRRELDLDDLLQARRAQLAGHADVVAFDAVLAFEISGAGQNLLLVLENGFGPSRPRPPKARSRRCRS
jgi:tetratricopeptide (TPR) repeat protein